MSSRHALPSLALALALPGASGCSYLFMERAPDVIAAPDYPVHCTSSRVAPIADTVYASSFAFATLIFAAMPRCSDDPANPGAETCAPSGEKAVAVAAWAALAAVTGVVAHRGFEAARACDRVRDLNALCITGREEACRALNSGWTPRGVAPRGAEWQP